MYNEQTKLSHDMQCLHTMQYTVKYTAIYSKIQYHPVLFKRTELCLLAVTFYLLLFHFIILSQKAQHSANNGTSGFVRLLLLHDGSDQLGPWLNTH